MEVPIDELPESYAVALRLRGAGVAPETIAAALGIGVEGVAPLLDIADRKLANLMAAGNTRTVDVAEG